MKQEIAKKIIIEKYSDMKLRNNFPDNIVEDITRIRNRAFADEINKGAGDFVGVLEEIENYLKKNSLKNYLKNLMKRLKGK